MASAALAGTSAITIDDTIAARRIEEIRPMSSSFRLGLRFDGVTVSGGNRLGNRGAGSVRHRVSTQSNSRVAALAAVSREEEDCRMPDREQAVSTRAVSKTFEAETAPVRALRGVDLAVDDGEFVAVMGPSGCGKSTLLNLIAGLDVPSAGEVVVAGSSLSGKGESELARMRRAHIGIVFQFHNLLG